MANTHLPPEPPNPDNPYSREDMLRPLPDLLQQFMEKPTRTHADRLVSAINAVVAMPGCSACGARSVAGVWHNQELCGPCLTAAVDARAAEHRTDALARAAKLDEIAAMRAARAALKPEDRKLRNQEFREALRERDQLAETPPQLAPRDGAEVWDEIEFIPGVAVPLDDLSRRRANARAKLVKASQRQPLRVATTYAEYMQQPLCIRESVLALADADVDVRLDGMCAVPHCPAHEPSVKSPALEIDVTLLYANLPPDDQVAVDRADLRALVAWVLDLFELERTRHESDLDIANWLVNAHHHARSIREIIGTDDGGQA